MQVLNKWNIYVIINDFGQEYDVINEFMFTMLLWEISTKSGCVYHNF